VPGGFGRRGIAGKIAAAKYARENNIPYLGICLGMQIAVIEFMRNVVGIRNAGSSEFDSDCDPVIDIMPTHMGNLGGTLRLGACDCLIRPETVAAGIYGDKIISERHRHRYEMNIKYESVLADNGMIISGKSPDGMLPEIIEIPKNRFFVAVQFHPEFESNPHDGHPLFSAFIKAALKS
jgi:CTP synthase